MDDVMRLICELKDNDPRVRRAVVEALGYFGDIRAFEPLVKVLEETNERWETVLAQDDIGQICATEPLVEMLRESGDDLILGRAVMDSLIVLGSDRISLRLGTALKNTVRKVHQETAKKLAVIGVPAIMPLTEMLKGEDAELRRVAAETLGQMAIQHPASELRVALPRLQSLSRSSGSRAIKKACRQAVLQIEEATATTKNLPLPAAPPPPSTENLPLPAEAPATIAENLPVPAAVPDAGVTDAETSPKPLQPGWRQRFRQALRRSHDNHG